MGGDPPADPAGAKRQAAAMSAAMPRRGGRGIAGEGPNEPAGAPSPCHTVLVAHEDRASRRNIRRALQGEGLRCLMADSGIQACRSIRTHRPEVVLMSLHLPDVSSLEIAGWMKEIEDLAATPLIALIVPEDGPDLRRVYASGYDICVLTRAPLDGLAATVWSVLRPSASADVDPPSSGMPRRRERPSSRSTMRDLHRLKLAHRRKGRWKKLK